MKNFYSFDMIKCKKIILQSISTNSIYIKYTLFYGSLFLVVGIIGFIIDPEPDIFSKNASVIDVIKTIGILLFATYTFSLGMVGTLVMLSLRSLSNVYLNKYLYETINVDKKYIYLVLKKKSLQIPSDSIDKISYIANYKKQIIGNTKLITTINLDIIEVSTSEKQFYIILDTIKDSKRFLEELGKIKAIEPVKGK